LKQSNRAAAKRRQGLFNWDITDVETGESARLWPKRTWEDIAGPDPEDIAEAEEEAKVTCYFCGLVCESIEDRDAHEEVCE
jgi:hypothetical protein